MGDRVRGLATAWLENYIAAFEAGRVQKHPAARFVNARGECCLAAAFAGARSGEEFVASPAWRVFLRGPLEAFSRDFEARRVSAQEVYEAVLLEAVARRVAAAPIATREAVAA
jgi:hypothetical protein